jgi:hypothetical protein
VRLLVLYQARDASIDQPGYFDGFERLVAEGALEAHRAIPYWGVAEEEGWPGLWQHAEEAARAMDADAVFLQFFHGSIPAPSEGIRKLKGLPSKPTIFTSLGDGFGRWLRRVPACFRAASALSDVTFLTGMGYLGRQLTKSGSRNLVLMPHGCCQVRFRSLPVVANAQPEFAVTFVGNRVRSRNPFSLYHWASRERTDFVEAFGRRYGRRFGLFGHGWKGNPAWQGPVPFAEQHEAYRRSAAAIGGPPPTDHDYYTSDREFIAAASGVPFVDYWVRGADRLLENGRDWWLARDLPQMMKLCDRILDLTPGERAQAGEATRKRVLEKHTQYHRCAEMVLIAKSVRDARSAGRKAPVPMLPFLLPWKGEGPAPESVMAWQG